VHPLGGRHFWSRRSYRLAYASQRETVHDRKGNAEFQRWWGRFERLGGSPSAVINLMRMNSGINIENILPSISVPTLVLHRTEDPTVSIQAGRFLAAHIPDAKLVELDGPDHVYYVGDNAMQIADLVADFAARPGTEARSTTASRRMLATILFTCRRRIWGSHF
jgi:pimeloyl-ACP methyl ester carboxylesterase